MTPATIRAARLSDAGEVAQLTTQLGYDLTEADATDRLSRILLQRDQQFFVAELDGLAVGWVHVVLAEYVDAEASVVIGGLVVDRDHRRQGIGRTLVDRAEVWARERGCSMVRLTSSATRNAAHRFYEGLGYTNIKTQYSFIKPMDPAAAARAEVRSARGPGQLRFSRSQGQGGAAWCGRMPQRVSFGGPSALLAAAYSIRLGSLKLD